MIVRRKAIRIKENPKHTVADERAIQKIINRGGKTRDEVYSRDYDNDSVRLNLRIPKVFMDRIEKDRADRDIKVCKNQWVVEAIAAWFASKDTQNVQE